MKIGTYYYPEQWPREQWERDFDNIAAMGLQIVHMGEFAWFDLEPEPGKFEFDWLKTCLDLATARKLDVILCTPTAAPPIWLSHTYPESLPVDAAGTRGRFGGRRHYSPTSPAMIEASKRIVTALADAFGDHPSVIGWQLDNEIGGSASSFDQSEHTHAGFRHWLKQKYKSIEKLNGAWGNQFWNTYYTSFDQILMPKGREPEYGNPHHVLDASRYWSHAWAQFMKLQADILKPKVGGRWITTNFMPFHPDANPGDQKDVLSLWSWDSYPVSGWDKDVKDETFRLADPVGISFTHDQMASYKNRWALMEVQPGTINWSGVPVLLYPGAVRLWLWTAWAHGAEFITVYRYRQPLWGIELFHHGLVGTDGVTPSPGGRQFVQVIDEMKRLAPIPDNWRPEAGDAGSVGLLFDFEQMWYYQTLPQAKRWNYRQWMLQWYAAAARLGLPIKILSPDGEWPADLKLIVAPGVQMVDDKLVKRWDGFAKKGGHLLLTCRTGLMNRHGHLWEGPTAAPIVPLIGATIEAYDSLPEGHLGKVDLGGYEGTWGAWGDLLFPESDTKTLAKYADQFYEGATAVTQKRHGKGIVTYCGVTADDAFTNHLFEKVAQQAGLDTSVLAPRTHVLRRGPYKILLNYQDKPVDAPAPAGVRFVVGSRRVEPAGVAVWEA